MKKISTALVLTFSLVVGSVVWAQAAPKISFAKGQVSVAENDGSVNLTVILSESSTDVVSVDFELEDIEAWDGAQYTSYGSGQDYYVKFEGNTAANGDQRHNSGTVVFAPGVTSATITIYINDDGTVEPDEKFRVVLQNPRNGNLGLYRCYVTIEDDDRDYLIAVTNPGTVNGTDLSSYALLNDGETDNRAKFQAMLDHFKAHESGKGVLFYFPAGTYLFDVAGTAVKLPTDTNKLCLTGPADGRDRFKERAILKMDVPYSNTSRLLDNSYGGYKYNKHVDSDQYALLIKCLVLDADNVHAGPYQAFEREQCVPVFISSNNIEGRLHWAMEKTFIKRSCTAAFNPYSNTVCSLYQFEAENCCKGFVVMSGRRTTLAAHDILSYGDTDPGGIWLEGYDDFYVTGSDWRILNGGRLYLSLPSAGGSSQYINLTRLYFGKGNWASVVISADEGQINISDSVLYVGTNPKMINAGTVNFTNCKLISYAEPDDTAAHCRSCPIPLVNYLHLGGCKVTYSDCIFSNDSKHDGYAAYGLHMYGNVNWDDWPDEYVKFVNCTFDSSLSGGIRYGYPQGSIGGLTTICENCTFNCNNETIGSETGYALRTSGWKDLHYHFKPKARAFFKDCIFNCALNKIFWIAGYSSPTDSKEEQNHCWLYLSGNISSTVNNDCITRGESFINLSIANAKSSVGISAIPRAAETLVTTDGAHGFSDGDKIMFDGFDDDDNADWFTNLSPHSNVPLFTVDYDPSTMATNEFKLRNGADDAYIDSSGFTADYDNTKDIARVSKYPVRTIQGNAGDNPSTSQPAGFVGDRYDAGGVYYRCIANGKAGEALWEAE